MDRKLYLILLFFILGCSSYYRRAEELYKKNKIEEAEAILLYALKKGEDSPELHFLLGKIYLKKGLYISAIKHFEKIVGKGKFRDELIECLKKIYEKTKRYGPEIAKNSLELIYLLSPDNLNFEEKKFLALYYAETKREEKAKIFIKEVISQNWDEELFLGLIRLLFNKKKYRDVFEFYREYEDKIVVSKNHENIMYYVGSSLFKLGKIYLNKENRDSAMFFLSKYIEFSTPRMYLGRAYLLRGKILLVKGDSSFASFNFRKVLEIMPFKSSGFVDEAKKYLKELRRKGYGG